MEGWPLTEEPKESGGGATGITWKGPHGRDWRKARGNRCGNRRCWWGGVSGGIEEVKRRKWAEFRDEFGDMGRDLALYLGRRLCGMETGGMRPGGRAANYGVMATNALFSGPKKMGKRPQNGVEHFIQMFSEIFR
jgi:hypothetical protein